LSGVPSTTRDVSGEKNWFGHDRTAMSALLLELSGG
jgi:hypothetical protein